MNETGDPKSASKKTTQIASLEEVRRRERAYARDQLHCVLTSTTDSQRVHRVRGKVSVGRHKASILVLEDPSVSRHHATIELAAGCCELTDLESSAGTTVNDEPVEGTTRLQDGDVVRFARGEGFVVSLIQGPEEDVISEAYRRAMVDPNVDVYNAGYLEQWMKAEVRAARRFLYPISVIVIEVLSGAPDAATEPQISTLLRSIAQRLERLAGPRAILARYDQQTLLLAVRQTALDGATDLAYAVDQALMDLANLDDLLRDADVRIGVAASEPMSWRDQNELLASVLSVVRDRALSAGRRVAVVPNR